MKEWEPTVFIVGGDTQSQQVLRRLMTSVGLVVEAYATANEFVEKGDPSRPGCLITELRMRGMSGIELQRQLRRAENRIPVVFLTAYADIPTAVQAMKEGAFYFLEKPFSEQCLLDQTQEAIAWNANDRRKQAEQQAAFLKFASLSPKEQSVLREILAGKTNKIMAHNLGITIKTVEFHRANIMKKVGADSISQLIYLLLKSGWDKNIDPDGPASEPSRCREKCVHE